MSSVESEPSVPRGGVYLGLGSNVGDRLAALGAALHAIDALPRTRVLRCSQVFETPAWGGVTTEPFLNGAAEIDTALQPAELLAALKTVETAVGRVPGPRYGPRLIDIDILVFRNVIVSLPGLTVPHPALPARRFVLQPLAELAPDLVIPSHNRSVIELLRECPDITPYPVFAPAPPLHNTQ
jgi:2-amino-4-hydroxy-6-hydroxymethyldihydropteridine diphosphokinase